LKIGPTQPGSKMGIENGIETGKGDSQMVREGKEEGDNCICH